jgi:putative endonuclease
MPPSPSRTPSDRRREAQKGGHRAEALAAFLLQLKLYRIRARRFKTPVGEIDLVAERGNMLVFVEVKQRGRGDDEATALEAVSQSRISRAADFWRMRHPDEFGKDCRFDVIFLAPFRWPRHLRDAFSAS